MSGMFSSPKAPDEVQNAQLQGQLNTEAAQTNARLNRYDTRGRYGDQIWSVDPNDPNHYTLSDNPSPVRAHQLDLQDFITTSSLQQIADQGPHLLANALSKGIVPEGAPMSGYDPKYGPDQRLQTDSGFWSAAPMQEDVNLAAAPGIPTADQRTRQDVTNAMYQQGAQYLDPQFAQQQQQMNSDLSNQGIFLGSDAYNTSQDNLARQKQMAYGDLRDRAILQGGEEMARDFGLGMQAHQAGVSDIMQSGQFHNQARGDMINQLLADMGARNQAVTGQANMGAQSAGLYNNARTQQMNENMAGAQFPVSLMQSIMSGSTPQQPNFQQYGQTQQIAPPDIYGAANQNYANQIGAQTARNQQVGQLATTAAMVYLAS